MDIDIITCLPDIFTSFFSNSIIKNAQKKNIVNIAIHNLRNYTTNKHKKTDDYAYGGYPGLVMTIQPIYDCIMSLKSKKNYDDIIYLCPDGEILTQNIVNDLSCKKNLILLCGHYKGIDERIRENIITREISIGEYVLSGGEIPACVLTDAIVRLIPGVLNNVCSALEDSFQNSLIAPPIYSRPENFNNMYVPKILLSGNKKKIDERLFKQAQKRTKKFKKINKNKK